MRVEDETIKNLKRVIHSEAIQLKAVRESLAIAKEDNDKLLKKINQKDSEIFSKNIKIDELKKVIKSYKKVLKDILNGN